MNLNGQHSGPRPLLTARSSSLVSVLSSLRTQDDSSSDLDWILLNNNQHLHLHLNSHGYNTHTHTHTRRSEDEEEFESTLSNWTELTMNEQSHTASRHLSEWEYQEWIVKYHHYLKDSLVRNSKKDLDEYPKEGVFMNNPDLDHSIPIFWKRILFPQCLKVYDID